MIKKIFTVLTGDVVGKILALIITFVLAKNLSIEDFGVYSYILRMLGLMGIVVAPFANIYLRDHRYFKFKKYDFSYIWISFILSIVFFAVLKHFIYHIPWPLFLFAATLIVSSAGKSYFNVYEEYKKFSLLYVLQEIGILAIISYLIFVLNMKTPTSLIFWSQAISIIIILLYLLKSIDKKNITFRVNFFALKKTYSDSFYLVFYWTLLPIIAFMDMFFVEKYLANYELGLYAFSLKLYQISLIGLAPMLTVLRIKQIDIARDSKYVDFLKRNIKKVSAFATVFYLLSVLTVLLITFIFFKEYKPSIWATIILVSTSFFSYLALPFSFLMAFRKYKLVFINSVVALMLNFIINYYFIPIYGILAAAASTFIAISFINISGMILSLVLSTKAHEKSKRMQK